MTLYDFFQEKVIPFFKGDYQDFSTKVVDGYSLYVATWDKAPRQAMITTNALALLQCIFDRYSASTRSKETDLQSSQISRWYVNGFTSAYNYCRGYDLDHPFEQPDFAQWSKKLKSSDDLERGEWTFEMFRKYTINFGRHEGTLFYVAEKEICNGNGKVEERLGDQPNGDGNSISPVVSIEEMEFNFNEELLKGIYENFNGKVFKEVTSLNEFKNIIERKPSTERLKGRSRKDMQMYKILYNFSQKLPKEIFDTWLKEIAKEVSLDPEKINKKHNGSDSSAKEYKDTMELIDQVFSKYSHL